MAISHYIDYANQSTSFQPGEGLLGDYEPSTRLSYEALVPSVTQIMLLLSCRTHIPNSNSNSTNDSPDNIQIETFYTQYSICFNLHPELEYWPRDQSN